MKKHEKIEDPYNKDKVIATMLKIIKKVYMRVGKEVYAKRNKSYGISSLRKKHLKIENGDLIIFRFKGKSNQQLYYSLRDEKIKDHLKEIVKLEGVRLFQYQENGKIKHVTD